MKLLVRQHLQSMKERQGLDVLLPQLLSEMGFEVIHHPRIGGRQAGVDVAAVGPDPDADDRRTLHLFVIKSGDVGRGDWDGSLQAVRPSLGEVVDDYIPNRVPPQYRELPIAVCVCMGGEIQEGVRAQWKGFADKEGSDQIAFREWNGERLANLILSGLLNAELLDPGHRAHFQKAVALVSEPDASYSNFRALLDVLSEDIDNSPRGTTRLRQMMICLWILVGNGIDAGNLDAPYRACELAMLHAWDAYRSGSTDIAPAQRKAREQILDHVLGLYFTVAEMLIVRKIGPHASKRHALSASARSRSALDVNLALFEILGRAALLGLWHHYLGCASEGDDQTEHLRKRNATVDIAIGMINANPTLVAPMRDDHQIEIGLLMLLAQGSGRIPSLDGYLQEVGDRLAYRYARRRDWLTHFRDYRQLLRHPVNKGDEYFQRSTCGSVLVPFVLTSLERVGATESQAFLERVVADHLGHMTQQVWVPSEETDDVLWRQGKSIGYGVPIGAPEIDGSTVSLSEEADGIAGDHDAVLKTEAIARGLVPLFLTACRHHRLPLPPHFWFLAEKQSEDGSAADGGEAA